MRRLHLIGAAIAAAAVPSSGLATVATAIFTGVIGDGTDNSGVLFEPGTSLAGRTIVARYRFDTAKGIVAGFDGGISAEGHTSWLQGSPILAVSITIDGRSVALPVGALSGGGYDERETYLTGSDQLSLHFQKAETEGAYSYQHLLDVRVESGFDFVDHLNLASPISYDVQAGDVSTGLFTIIRDGPRAQAAGGSFTIVNVTIAPVPEPGVWAMMAAGFAMIGGAVRRGRRRLNPVGGPI